VSAVKTAGAVIGVVAAIGYLSGTGPAGGAVGRVPSGHDPQVIRVVYEVGRAHGASDKVMLAAFEACLVESHCQNLNHGHSDSLGVFQQRPSQGWGSPEQVTNVRYAATQFFVRAKANEPDYRFGSAGQLAQSVQGSAFPDRYDQAESRARALLAKAATRNT
jgi:hypothetical protein